MHTHTLTLTERERYAYVQGDAETAAMLAGLIDAEEDAACAEESFEKEIEAERDRTREATDAWEDLFFVWQDNIADGRWPGAGVSDFHLQSVMRADIERAGTALQELRELLAEIKDADDAPEWLKARAETISERIAEE
jgi:hypothetical protein